MLNGGETENLLWTQKPPTRFMIETFQLTTLAVCCGYITNLIGRRTINIPEIILGVHGLMGFTVILLFISQPFSITTVEPIFAARAHFQTNAQSLSHVKTNLAVLLIWLTAT